MRRVEKLNRRHFSLLASIVCRVFEFSKYRLFEKNTRLECVLELKRFFVWLLHEGYNVEYKEIAKYLGFHTNTVKKLGSNLLNRKEFGYHGQYHLVSVEFEKRRSEVKVKHDD